MATEAWLERSVEILAVIDPPRSGKPSPPNVNRKLPTDSVVQRERNKKPRTPPPPHDTLLVVPRNVAGTLDMIGRRKSPRKSEEKSEVGMIGSTSRDQVASSSATSVNPRVGWHEWQQSNPDRKLPRLILKVRDPL